MTKRAQSKPRKSSNLRYVKAEERSRDEIEQLLDSSDPSSITSGLRSAIYYEPDWRWIQSQCLRFLRHPEMQVRWAAATFLGDIAIVHQTLDLELVLPALKDALKDTSIKPAAQESLDFIRHYVKVQ